MQTMFWKKKIKWSLSVVPSQGYN